MSTETTVWFYQIFYLKIVANCTPKEVKMNQHSFRNWVILRKNRFVNSFKINKHLLSIPLRILVSEFNILIGNVQSL